MANEEHLSILRQGVKVWNEWREQNPGVVPDLKQANLERANLEKANLLEANLEEVNLEGANLEGANLEGANLEGAKLLRANLKKAGLWGANLKEAELWVANLEEAQLPEVNLLAAQLWGANLKGADLWEANLREASFLQANLEQTILLATQALGASFERATLTGACIQDWNINADTNFEGVVCEYVYRSWNIRSWQPRERRPHAGTFAPGEFTKLFQLQNVLKTAEISFPDGIDWQAFWESFQSLQNQVQSQDLSIQGIENKSGGAFVIRLEVPADADKEQIETYIKTEYEAKLKLIEANYEDRLKFAGERVDFYLEQVAVERHRNTELTGIVKTMAEQQPKVQQTFNAPVGGVAGNVEGNQIINQQQSQNLAEAAAEIEQLLTQLSQTYPTETTSDKMMVAAEVMKRVESNPSLKQKLVRAIKEGGIAALDSFLDHPLASFFIAAAQSFAAD